MATETCQHGRHLWFCKACREDGWALLEEAVKRLAGERAEAVQAQKEQELSPESGSGWWQRQLLNILLPEMQAYCALKDIPPHEDMRLQAWILNASPKELVIALVKYRKAVEIVNGQEGKTQD